jgi:hypothetical protein
VKFKVEPLRLTGGTPGATTKVTGIAKGLFDAPATVTVMLPWYVAAFSPVVSTDTPSSAGPVPEPGLTDSHEPPEVVLAATVKLRPAATPRLRPCDNGAEPPSVKLKVKEEGDAVMAGALVTTKVTLTTCEVAPGPATVTVPL